MHMLQQPKLMTLLQVAKDPFVRLKRHNRKIALVHAIMLVMHALTIACSFVISAADRGKYCGTTAYNTVKIAGVDTLVYGTRYMISLVLAEIMEYGDSLSVQEMRAAFRETFRLAAIHVKEGYLMNVAIGMALKGARDEWKAGLRRPQRPRK